MAPLLVVTGPPGAGKSTVARLLADRFEPSALVEGDAFFAFLARGAIEPWLPESAGQNEVVIQAAATAAGRFAAGGITTVYDGVLGPWFLASFAAATGVAALDYVVLMPSEGRCVEQVAGRTGHGFADEAATRQMHREFALAMVDPRHVVVDPDLRPEVVADTIVAALAAGRLRYEGDDA
jgi:cytidylate kinase